MPNGFEPVFDQSSEILILGSFPSVLSREQAFYYGNPRNRFWRLIGEIYGEDIGNSVAEKTAFLLRRHIALWDVVTSCDIIGSLDANIKNPVIANLPELVAAAPIKKIFCNGGKSYELLKRYFPSFAPMTDALPSTSPANVRFDKTVWIAALKPFAKRETNL